jgi:hypothetical protein
MKPRRLLATFIIVIAIVAMAAATAKAWISPPSGRNAVGFADETVYFYWRPIVTRTAVTGNPAQVYTLEILSASYRNNVLANIDGISATITRLVYGAVVNIKNSAFGGGSRQDTVGFKRTPHSTQIAICLFSPFNAIRVRLLLPLKMGTLLRFSLPASFFSFRHLSSLLTSRFNSTITADDSFEAR